MSHPRKHSILFVSHKYPPATGGMEKQSFELINGMEAYVNVHKIVFDGNEPLLTFFWKLNRRILACIHANPDISVVHFNDGLIASFALFHKGYDHLKRVVTVHGLDVVFPWRFFQRRILPKFNRYDLFIAVSQATADALVRRGIDRAKVKVVRNGVDQQLAERKGDVDGLKRKYRLPERKHMLVLLGRPVKRKGFSWFVEYVLPYIDERYYLLMIGPFNRQRTAKERFLSLIPRGVRHLWMLFLGFPSDESTIRRLLSDPKYNTRCTHLGKLPYEELQTFLAEAAAFLMPNIEVAGDMEGFGLVCLEASLSGTLVLASELEGITDAVVNGKNGVLLPSQDPEAWIKRLNEIAWDQSGYEQLAQKYKRYTLENYGWDRMCEGYFQWFEQVIAKGAV